MKENLNKLECRIWKSTKLYNIVKLRASGIKNIGDFEPELQRSLVGIGNSHDLRGFGARCDCSIAGWLHLQALSLCDGGLKENL